jgi:hypothetical protein
MVSSNKILTVSYGTFSCTLEGFDNSFDTMKAIAEYFRDLAQDDRYFGAEPPTPDAEMLARIAEREIARRVEARFEKGNLVLRPTDEAETPQGDVAPDPSSSDAPSEGATAGVAATALAVADTPDDSPLSTTDLSSDSSHEDVATYTSDTHIAEDKTDVAEADDEIDIPDLAPAQDVSDEIVAEDMTEDEVENELEIDTDALGDADETDADDTPAPDIAAVAGLEDAAGVEAHTETDAEDVVAAPVAVTDSVADKLQRIRAVVASKSQPAPTYIEDEHAMSGPDGDGIDDNDAIDVDDEVAFETEETDAEVASPPLDDDDDNIFADTIAAALSDQIDETPDVAETDVTEDGEAHTADGTETEVAENTAVDEESEIEALRAKIAELEAKAAVAQTPDPSVSKKDAAAISELYEDEDHRDEDADDDSAPLVLDADSSVDADSPEDEDAAPAPIVARVAKAKRAEVEAALAAGDIEEYEDEREGEGGDTAEAAVLPGADDSSLTPEQEAELARELAELHAEIEEDDDWNFDTDEDDDSIDFGDDAEDDDQPILSDEAAEEADANIRKAVKLTSPARAMLTEAKIEENDDSVERLADMTETEMDEPEGNRRRSAIAHLRAAVAATKAERLLGLGKKTVDEEEPYREDLADAVRPRRPKVTQSRSERPAPVRPAPLKLVAEQRVDMETAAPKDVAPVRPRRVLRSSEAVDAPEMATDDAGFAEFAENQGANTLPELLEAAAAYMSFVEGHDQFSRPQLMTKLHQAEGEASSREERLRSFGQLLREGKIQKKGGGRFAASDSIGFKPNKRAAG